MKKAFLIIAILGLAAFFTGCSLTNNQKNSNGVATTNQNLNQNTENENSLANVNVSLGGQVADVTTTYQDTAYGFSIQWPKDWTLIQAPNALFEDSKNVLALTSPEQRALYEQMGGYDTASADIYISVFNSVTELNSDINTNVSLQGWLQGSGVAGQAITDVKATTFAGSPAFTAFSGSQDAADPQIYVEHSGKIFVITTSRMTDDNDSKKVADDAIINTFRFID